MYPFCCREGTYPTGKGTIISHGDYMSNKIQLSQIFGPIACSMLPPTDTLYPILGVKMHSRLMFPLCYTCAKNLNPERCKCKDEARVIRGCWTSLEIQRALETGYKMIDFHEALHFDSKNRSPGGPGNIFYDYMNQFYFLKATNSGWPSWCKSEKDKQLYLDRLSKEVGFEVKESQIQSNPNLKFIGKLLLNSLSIFIHYFSICIICPCT